MSDQYPPETKYSKPYDHTLYEKLIYQEWLNSGYFNPDNLPERFTGHWCTIVPPPNANGRLHAGHGLDVALKDTFGRYHRSQGKKVLIVPGADHAGFETQVVYEKQLEKEGRSRFGMDPKELYREIYDFTMENKQYMEDDLRSLGMSCDWSRNTFTLDPAIVTKVQESFIKLHEQGHVYRGKRISNWCSKHQTSLSDIETENKENVSTFYTFQYGPFQIGTVRPETKFADKYVIVHPNDERYAQYEHGQVFEVEWINGPITATLLKDEAADPEMGTGAMTITPWHSAVDFELAKKYNLPLEQIIDESGKLLPVAGEFAGMKIAAARPAIIEKLREKGLLVSEDTTYKNVVNCCYKCGTIIEPQVRDQWYVKMDYFCNLALEASRTGEVEFVSEQFKKTMEYWMSNPQDWNISRQIVWGIGIPAWYRNKGAANEEVHVGQEAPDASGAWIKETDTFDTWFSSGQWPLLTLGYPDSDDFKNYYPTNLMETGRDLIFKWVPRMIFFGKHFTGQAPFKTVYMHGMVNDEKNQKMSKSKGNVLSPIDLSNEFGTDSLRMSLIIGMTPGNDTPLSKDKLRAQKKFINKLWNIARFVIENTTAEDLNKPNVITQFDQEFITRLNETGTSVSKAIETYALHLAAEELYHFAWHDLADKVIENIKNRVKENPTNNDSVSGRYALRTGFRDLLIMLHPFIPFVTEEMWKDFGNGELLMIAQWPKA
jgi:valyl-tRNA synthetase